MNGQQRLIRAAYHEAGHAVMAYLCGAPLGELSVTHVSEAGRWDGCRGWLGPPQRRVADVAGALPGRWLEVEVRCLLAGGVAEARLLGQPNWRWGARDVAAAAQRARWRGGPRAERTRYLAAQLACTRAQLTAPDAWRAVRSVAAALQQHGALDSGRARSLIEVALATSLVIPTQRANARPRALASP